MTNINDIETHGFNLLKAGKISIREMILMMESDLLNEVGFRWIKGRKEKINPNSLPANQRRNRNWTLTAYAIITYNGTPIDLDRYDAIVNDHNGELKHNIEFLNDLYPGIAEFHETSVSLHWEKLPSDLRECKNGHYKPSDYCKAQKPELAHALKYCSGWNVVKSRLKRKALIQTIAQPFYTSTGRCQYSASKEFDGDLLLLPKCFRVLIDPKADLYEVDATAQDFYTTATLSGDEKMLEDYGSSDVYMSFIMNAGLNISRDTAKMMLLGIIKGMSAHTIAKNAQITISDAKKLIQHIFDRYKTYRIWSQLESGLVFNPDGSNSRNEFGVNLFNDGHLLTTPMGFNNSRMLATKGFDDRYNAAIAFRSQAYGSVILYKTIVRAIRENIPVHATLHDAIYVAGAENAQRVDQLFRESSLELLGYEMKTKIKKIP